MSIALFGQQQICRTALACSAGLHSADLQLAICGLSIEDTFQVAPRRLSLLNPRQMDGRAAEWPVYPVKRIGEKGQGAACDASAATRVDTREQTATSQFASHGVSRLHREAAPRTATHGVRCSVLRGAATEHGLSSVLE
jgi:hypothetical protein